MSFNESTEIPGIFALKKKIIIIILHNPGGVISATRDFG